MADEQTTQNTDTTQGSDTQQQATTTKPEAKFTQDDMNSVVSNEKKQAAIAERKRLYKELGIEDTDDPKALETVKGKLTAAQKAEEDRLSELEKATKRAEEAEKKAAETEARIAATEARRIADKVDARIAALADKPPFNALDAGDVVTWLRNNEAEAVKALVGDDEKIDDAKAAKLIEKVKLAKDHWFKKASGVGSPSISGGRSLQPNEDLNKQGLQKLRQQLRNG